MRIIIINSCLLMNVVAELVLPKLTPRERVHARLLSSAWNDAGAGAPLYSAGELPDAPLAWSPDGDIVICIRNTLVCAVRTDVSRVPIMLPRLNPLVSEAVAAVTFSRDASHLFIAYTGHDIGPYVRVQSMNQITLTADTAVPCGTFYGMPLIGHWETECVEFAPGATAECFRLLRGASSIVNPHNCAIQVFELRPEPHHVHNAEIRPPWQLVHYFQYGDADDIRGWFSPDAMHIASSTITNYHGDNGENADDLNPEILRIYRMGTEAKLATIAHPLGIQSLGWSPDGLHVLTVDRMSRAREYSIATGAFVRQFLGVSCLALQQREFRVPLPVIFNDGHVELILRDGSVRAVRVTSDVHGAPQRVVIGGGSVKSAIASPDGSALAVQSANSRCNPRLVNLE